MAEPVPGGGTSDAKNSMRILHVVYSCIPTEFRGGVSKVAFSLARAQAALGHDVSIFATNYNSSVPIDVPFNQVVVCDDVQIRYFPVEDARWFRSTAMRRQLRQEAGGYEVLHGHNTFLALNRYAMDASQAGNTRLFYHVHGALDPVVVRKGRLKKWRKLAYIRLVEKRHYQTADGLFALSAMEAQQIRSYGITTPIHVMPNGVDAVVPAAQSEARFRQRFSLSPGDPLVLYLGRIVPKKGVHLLLTAFAQVWTAFPAARLVIAGNAAQDPAYFQRLQQLVAQEGMEGAVIWAGFLDEQEKAAAFAAATIFSHVTESEGMPIAALEAMAAGTPTIVSPGCNLGDAVKAGAVLESPYDVSGVRNAMESLLISEPTRRTMSRLARQFAQQHHAWSTIAAQITDAYTA